MNKILKAGAGMTLAAAAGFYGNNLNSDNLNEGDFDNKNKIEKNIHTDNLDYLDKINSSFDKIKIEIKDGVTNILLLGDKKNSKNSDKKDFEKLSLGENLMQSEFVFEYMNSIDGVIENLEKYGNSPKMLLTAALFKNETFDKNNFKKEFSDLIGEDLVKGRIVVSLMNNEINYIDGGNSVGVRNIFPDLEGEMNFSGSTKNLIIYKNKVFKIFEDGLYGLADGFKVSDSGLLVYNGDLDKEELTDSYYNGKPEVILCKYDKEEEPKTEKKKVMPDVNFSEYVQIPKEDKPLLEEKKGGEVYFVVTRKKIEEVKEIVKNKIKGDIKKIATPKVEDKIEEVVKEEKIIDKVVEKVVEDKIVEEIVDKNTTEEIKVPVEPEVIEEEIVDRNITEEVEIPVRPVPVIPEVVEKVVGDSYSLTFQLGEGAYTTKSLKLPIIRGVDNYSQKVIDYNGDHIIDTSDLNSTVFKYAGRRDVISSISSAIDKMSSGDTLNISIIAHGIEDGIVLSDGVLDYGDISSQMESLLNEGIKVNLTLDSCYSSKSLSFFNPLINEYPDNFIIISSTQGDIAGAERDINTGNVSLNFTEKWNDFFNKKTEGADDFDIDLIFRDFQKDVLNKVLSQDKYSSYKEDISSIISEINNLSNINNLSDLYLAQDNINNDIQNLGLDIQIPLTLGSSYFALKTSLENKESVNNYNNIKTNNLFISGNKNIGDNTIARRNFDLITGKSNSLSVNLNPGNLENHIGSDITSESIFLSIDKIINNSFRNPSGSIDIVLAGLKMNSDSIETKDGIITVSELADKLKLGPYNQKVFLNSPGSVDFGKALIKEIGSKKNIVVFCEGVEGGIDDIDSSDFMSTFLLNAYISNPGVGYDKIEEFVNAQISKFLIEEKSTKRLYILESQNISQDENITVDFDENNTSINLDENNTSINLDENNTSINLDENNTSENLDENNTSINLDENNTSENLDENNISEDINSNYSNENNTLNHSILKSLELNDLDSGDSNNTIEKNISNEIDIDKLNLSGLVYDKFIYNFNVSVDVNDYIFKAKLNITTIYRDDIKEGQGFIVGKQLDFGDVSELENINVSGSFLIYLSNKDDKKEQSRVLKTVLGGDLIKYKINCSATFSSFFQEVSRNNSSNVEYNGYDSDKRAFYKPIEHVFRNPDGSVFSPSFDSINISSLSSNTVRKQSDI